MAQKGINEQQRDEVRALLIALGYDEKLAGDMAAQVFWSDRAIADMKYKLAQKAKAKKAPSPNGESSRRRRNPKAIVEPDREVSTLRTIPKPE